MALSNITIVGGTLANLAFNVQRRHPARHGPLIDWDLIMVMEPSTILGALVGGYLNKVRQRAGRGCARLCVRARARACVRARVRVRVRVRVRACVRACVVFFGVVCVVW